MASGFIVEAAKLAYQGDRESHMVDLVLPNLGEHLCFRSYLAPVKRTQVVVHRGNAILELKSHWPDVLKAIKSELEAWAHHGCIRRKQ